MIKKLLVALSIMCSAAQLQAQTTAPADDLNCYNKWSVKFDSRGAEDVADGVYTDVIVTSRVGGKANCWSGKAEVLHNKLLRCYITLEDGTFEEVKRTWKNGSNKEVAIVNGISTSMVTVHNELINVLWPNKIKAKKPAAKKAPDPTDD
jgi:hypothetical protein